MVLSIYYILSLDLTVVQHIKIRIVYLKIYLFQNWLSPRLYYSGNEPSCLYYWPIFNKLLHNKCIVFAWIDYLVLDNRIDEKLILIS